MTDSNRMRLTSVRETSLGVTPGSPSMWTARITGENLRYVPQFVTSDEMRSDRMNADPTKSNELNDGPVNYELSYPVPGSPLSDWFTSLFFNDWVNTPVRDNGGVADSVITGVAATGGVVTVLTGAAFAVGHLVQMSGFGAAGNNGLFRITTGSATVPAVGASLLTDEPIPPGTARVKVVGFQGASADIAAVADGLTATALNFTTLGLVVGQWVKIGGAGAAYSYATAANNGYARIVAITATKLTLDNLPTGWTADVGTGKTLRVFFGDTLKNGTTFFGNTLERGFLAQAVPNYIVQRGMVANKGEINFATEDKITGNFEFVGLRGGISTTTLNGSPVAATVNKIMTANVNVGRIAESGVAVGSPNYVKSAKIAVDNNVRLITAVGSLGAVDMGMGECGVTGQLETHFGDSTFATKLINGTVGNLNFRTQKDNQAVVFAVPRVTFTDGSPSAGGKNQDVMLPLNWQASFDALTTAHLLMDRFEYVE